MLSFTFTNYLLPLSKLANEQLREAKGKHRSFQNSLWTENLLLRTFKLWNNLEFFLQLSTSVKSFKRSLRSQLLDNFVNTS